MSSNEVSSIPILNGHDDVALPKPPLGTGPPTREELAFYYPAKFNWQQLKTFVNSGDLGLLKRDKALQKRYAKWAEGVRAEYGSIVNYLLTYRLQWGKHDNLSRLGSAIPESEEDEHVDECKKTNDGLPIVPDGAPTYFTADTPPMLISIIQNDWPYSVPPEIEHTLVWTCLPILPPPSLLPPHIASSLSQPLLSRVTARLEQDGIWGFTGLGPDSPPPSPSLLPQSLGALSEWGITMDKLIKSAKGTPDEEAAIQLAGDEVQKFIKNRWKESDWETAWFVNPPRLQSVKGLAHVHVFARKKT